MGSLPYLTGTELAKSTAVCKEFSRVSVEASLLLKRAILLTADPPSGALSLVHGWRDMRNSGALLETVEALDLAVKEGSELLGFRLDEVRGRMDTCKDSAFEAAFAFAQAVAGSFMVLFVFQLLSKALENQAENPEV